MDTGDISVQLELRRLRALETLLLGGDQMLKAITNNGGDALANQNAPNSVVIAAVPFLPKSSGELLVQAQLGYTVSGADNIGLALNLVENPTSISGGTANGHGYILNGGAITVTGGSSSQVTDSLDNTSASVSQSILLSTPVIATVGVPCVLVFTLLSFTGKNYTGLVLNSSVIELLGPRV